MAKFSIKSFALKWYLLTCPSGGILYAEYSSLFMKQLGFNPAQIGLTSLFGLPQLFMPLYLLFGEKFRARKTLAFMGTFVLLLTCTLPLLAVIVPALQPTCYSATSTDSAEGIQHASHTSGSVRSEYANVSNNRLTVSKITKTARSLPDLRFTITPALKNLSAYPISDDIRNTLQPTSRKQLHSAIPNSTWKSSSPTNYPHNSTPIFKINLPRLGALFFILTLSRSLTMYFACVDVTLANLATITHLKEEEASFGAYFMWTHIGSTIAISFVAFLAWLIKIDICGIEMPGYLIAFICAGFMTLLSMVSLPWFKFEYNEKKSFNWSGVKSDVFNAHYIFMFAAQFYAGLCVSFQMYWEFWYLDGLSASPLLLAGAVLIRRPLVAITTLGSGYLISRIGDLNTICFAFFLFSTSFLALSFTRIACLVLVVDTFQAAANGISFCAFTVLFYKASSKENSSMILGKSHMTSCTLKARKHDASAMQQ
jgi:hypothetical protein